MAEGVPWYLDFRSWRLRRSSLETVKLLKHAEPIRAGGGRVFWELRGFAAGLQFAGRNWSLARWLGDAEKGGVLADFEACGLDPSDFLLSKKAMTARSRARNEPAPDTSAAPVEFMVPTEGLLVILARWSNRGPKERRGYAEAELFDVVAYSLGLQAADVRLRLHVPEQAVGVACNRPSGQPGCPCKHAADVLARFGNVALLQSAAGQWQAQKDLLVRLYERREDCPSMQLWFTHVARTLAEHIDRQIFAGVVGCASPKGLHQLQGRSRALRLDPELRRLATRDNIQNGEYRSAAGAARGGGIQLAISTARKLTASHMADYFWSTFRHVRQCPQLCISMDSTSVNGEDTMTLAWWSPGLKQGGKSPFCLSIRVKAREEMGVMYKKFGSTLHVVARLLADRQREVMCRVLVETIQPIMTAHGKELSQLRAPEAVLEYSIGYARGSYTFVIRKVFAVLTNAHSYSFVGLGSQDKLGMGAASVAMPKDASSGSGGGGVAQSGSSSSSSRVPAALSVAVGAIAEDEKVVARAWLQLATKLASFRLTSMMQWTDYYPNQFASLLSKHERTVRDALGKAKLAWAAICAAEERRHASVAVQSLFEVVDFADQLISREVFLMLDEFDFEFLQPECEAVLRTAFTHFGHSAINENAHNVIRDHLRDVKNQAQSRLARYTWPHAEGVMAQFQREEISAGANDRPGTRDLPTGVFEAYGSPPTVDQGLLEEIMSPRPSWPVASPQSAMLRPFAWRLMLWAHEHQEWAKLDKAWVAVLVPEGEIIKQSGPTGRFWMVLRSTQYGLLLWLVSRKSHSTKDVFTVDSSADSGPCFIPVFDSAEIHVVPTCPATPLVLRRQGVEGGLPDEVCCMQEGPLATMYTFGARRAFGQVTDFWLGRLLHELGIAHLNDGIETSTVLGKVERLVRFLAPEATDEEIVAILALRASHKLGSGTTLDNLKLHEVNMDAVDNLCDASDKQMLKSDIAQEDAEGNAKSKVVNYLMARGLQVPESLRHLKRKAAPEPPAPVLQDKERVLLTKTCAKKYLPKAKGVVLQPYPTLKRFQVYYPTEKPPFSHCQTFGPGGNTERKALALCLEWCWHKHRLATSEICPFEFVHGDE